MDSLIGVLALIGGAFLLAWAYRLAQFISTKPYIERIIGAMEAQDCDPIVIELFMGTLEGRYGREQNKDWLERILKAKKSGMPPSEFAHLVSEWI